MPIGYQLTDRHPELVAELRELLQRRRGFLQVVDEVLPSLPDSGLKLPVGRKLMGGLLLDRDVNVVAHLESQVMDAVESLY